MADKGPRKLKYFHPGACPRRFLVIDTETTEHTLSDIETVLLWRLGAGGVFDRDQGEPALTDFGSPREVLDWIEQEALSRGTTWLFAHNLYFDLRIARLHRLLPTAGWRMKSCYFAPGGFNCFIVLRRGKQTLKLVNSYNLLPMALREIGALMGYRKGSVNFERVNDERLARYCRRDVKVLGRALVSYMDWCDEHAMGRMAMTTASQAYTALQSGYLNCRVYFHDDSALQRLESEAYHGGRVECFRLGRIAGPVFCLDVNSMYPQVMREGLMPVRLEGWRDERAGREGEDRPEAKSLLSLIQPAQGYFTLPGAGETRLGILARCTVNTERPQYPLMLGGKLIFPVGRFETTLAPSEFFRAWQAGEVENVQTWACYALGDPFSRWIDTLIEIKERAERAGDPLRRKIAKLFMNSLYGKFAEQVPDLLYEGDCPPDEFGADLVITEQAIGTRWRIMGHEMIWGDTRSPTERTNFAIAAEITARARLKLYDLIEGGGSGNVYYCDTDSVFVNRAGLARLRDRIGPNLGELKREWRAPTVALHGLKDYELPTHRKIKGVRGDAQSLPDGSGYTQTRWSGIRSDLRAGRTEGITLQTQVKHLSRDYTKGRVLEDGRVQPFRLPEDEAQARSKSRLQVSSHPGQRERDRGSPRSA